jgi:hypothetical protein
MKRNLGFVLVILLVLAFISTGFTTVAPVIGNVGGCEPLTSQVWANYVSSDPGHLGSTSIGGQAAYGLPGDADDDDYVGNYFYMEQETYVSSGETKGQIDISSPYSLGYLSESMSVTGMARNKVSFSMENLPAGSTVSASWWEIF